MRPVLICLVTVCVLFMAGTASAQVAFGKQSQRDGQEPLVRSEKAPVQVPGSSPTATGEMALIKATPAPDIQTKEVPVKKEVLSIAKPGETRDQKIAVNPANPRVIQNNPGSDLPRIQTTYLSEGFENGGSIPAGWTDHAGTYPWLYNSGNLGYPVPGAPHGGSYAACFNVYSYPTGAKDTLVSPVVTLTGNGNYQLVFWSWDNTDPYGAVDSACVVVKYGAGTWQYMATVPHNSSGWIQNVVNFQTSQTTMQFGFAGYSDYGHTDPYIDDVTLADPVTSGRCCYGNPYAPSCVDIIQAGCNALGGTWTPGATCAGNPCPVPSFTNCPPVMISEFAGEEFSFLFAADDPLGEGQLAWSILDGPGTMNDSTGYYSIVIDSTARDTIAMTVQVCNGIGCDTCAFQIEVYPILPGPGPLVVEGYPSIWNHLGGPAQNYAIFPRARNVLVTNDTLQAIIYLKNITPTSMANVQATMECPPGFMVLNDFVDYGTIPPSASSPGIFSIITSNADIGTHPIILHVSSEQGDFDLKTWFSTWALNFNILDTLGGIFEGTLSTPFHDMTFNMVAPEDTSYRPYFFDLSQINATLINIIPFFGTQSYLPVQFSQGEQGNPSDFCTLTKTAMIVNTNTGQDRRMAGARFEITGPDGVTRTGITDENGECVTNVPRGVCTYVLKPPAYENAYFQNEHGSIDLTPFLWLDLNSVYTDIPDGVPLEFNAPPANVQGEAGDHKQRSILVSVGAAAVATAADVAIIGVSASWWAIALCAAGVEFVTDEADEAADPEGVDIFNAGRAATPPASDSELTSQENISVAISYNQAPSFDSAFSFNATWHYERITNVQSYTWDSSATYWIENCLPIVIQTNANEYSSGDTCIVFARITNPASDTLAGGQVVAYSWLTSEDMNEAFDQRILADDGQWPDSVANDGIYSGILPIGSLPNGMYKVAVLAKRTGFENDENPPPSFGFASADISIGGGLCQYIPGDINGNATANGIDVTYGVSYLKGGSAPPDSCNCPPLAFPFYAAMDVNGNCAANGIDITYFVSYLKGGQPALLFCAGCPPGRMAAPPAPAVMPIYNPSMKERGNVRPSN